MARDFRNFVVRRYGDLFLEARSPNTASPSNDCLMAMAYSASMSWRIDIASPRSRSGERGSCLELRPRSSSKRSQRSPRGSPVRYHRPKTQLSIRRSSREICRSPRRNERQEPNRQAAPIPALPDTVLWESALQFNLFLHGGPLQAPKLDAARAMAQSILNLQRCHTSSAPRSMGMAQVSALQDPSPREGSRTNCRAHRRAGGRTNASCRFAEIDPHCWLFVAFGLNTAMRHRADSSGPL